MTGWESSGTVAADFTETNGRTGNRLTHWYNGAYDCYTFQTLSGLADGTYRMSAYTIGGTATDAYIYASGFGGAEVQAAIPPAAWGNWTLVTLDNIQVVNGFCTIGIATVNSEWTSIDDVSFELVSSASSNLALNKPATASSAQSGNGVANANDDDTNTRWCASSGALGEWWQVDLGAVSDISSSEIVWEFADRAIGYEISVSTNGSSFTTVSSGTSTSQNTVSNFTASARYVRVTVTSLPANTWASFREFSVYGVGGPSGGSGSAIEVLANHGFNYARVRLLVNPPGDYGLNQDLDYVIAMAQEIKANNMKFLLDIFYSNWWCDPAQNWAPDEWSNINSINLLKNEVSNHTAAVLAALGNAGVAPDMVQVGNEINPGMCWPLGRLETNGWTNLVTLTNAGYDAVKAYSSSIPVMIHYAGVGSGAQSWYSNYVNNQGKMDVLGCSFYEAWHGNIQGAVNTINNLYNTHGKPVYLVETAAYWRPSEGGNTTSYPHTKQGQYDFLYDLTTAIKDLPGFAGLFYWGATWTQSNQWLVAPSWGDDDAGARGLFDNSAKINPAADAIMAAGPLAVMGVDVSEAHFAQSNGVNYSE